MSTLDHCNPNSSNSIQTQSDLNPAITTDTTITPSNSTLLDLLDQLTLTIQCLDDSLPEAQPDDPVYRTFLSLPNHTLPLLWTDLESSLNAIGRDDFLSADLKRGVFGLESVVPFLQHARRHPSWESYDILLQPILEQILRCVIERCTQPAVSSLSPIAIPASIAYSSDPPDGQASVEMSTMPSMQLTPTPSAQHSDSLMVHPEGSPQLNKLIEVLQNNTTPPSVGNSRKRNSTTVAYKIQVIEHHNREGATQKQTAKQFGLTQSQLSRWLKEEDELREYVMDKGSSSKRQRTGDFPQIEDTLLRYYIEAKSRNIAPSDDNLKDRTKALMKLYQISDDALKVSNGWLLRFKGRNNIKSYVRPAPPLFLESRIVTVREQLRTVTDGYALRDIYAADEVGLFCNLSPLIGPLCVNPADRTRLTYLLCANADGSDKRIPLAIGNSQDPVLCGDPSVEKTHLYRYNSRGWMSGPVFAEWIKKFDREMQRQNRHVLVLVDDCSAHVYDADTLLNVKVHFLPSNTDIETQPLAAGVMQTFKSNYRRNLLESCLVGVEQNGEVTLAQEQSKAMRCALSAWAEVTAHTIQNCFAHTGIVSVRLSDGRTLLDHQAPVPTYVAPQASDLDMEKSLMATQSALIQLQRDQRLPEGIQLTIDELLDLPGEQNREGWEMMPTDEELVTESQFLAAQVKEELKHRKKEEKDTPLPKATRTSNRPKPTGKARALQPPPSSAVKLKPVSNSGGGLHMVPMSVQETIQSFEQIEYSLPFYLDEEAVGTHLQHLQILKRELRKALTGPNV